MSVADILDKAADLIEPEGAWTQGYYAKDETGHDVDAGDKDAKCFCALGAIRRAGGYFDDMNPAAQILGLYVGDLVCDWNDGSETTQSEVVAALRAAAEKARK